MDYGAARARAQEAEEQLDLSEPASLNSTHRDLERLRGRKIVIQPMNGMPTDKVCG